MDKDPRKLNDEPAIMKQLRKKPDKKLFKLTGFFRNFINRLLSKQNDAVSAYDSAPGLPLDLSKLETGDVIMDIRGSNSYIIEGDMRLIVHIIETKDGFKLRRGTGRRPMHQIDVDYYRFVGREEMLDIELIKQLRKEK